MNIKIHRGENQIGGNIIEVSTKASRILLDIGLELDDEKNKELPHIEGLFDKKGFDAIFISHYHGDHIGLAYKVDHNIPLYMGVNSYKVIKASDNYKKAPSIIPTGYLSHNQKIRMKDLTITPFLCDHSAFDSYMLLVEDGIESLLYTGDFRSNGRKSFSWLLNSLPQRIDYLICEGTTLSREGCVPVTEEELEEQAVNLFSKSEGPIFVLQSLMNIDRIVTMYRSAKQNGRIFLEDLYMAEITSAIDGNIPNPINFSDVKAFTARPYDSDHFRYKLLSMYGKNKISKAKIADSKFVMCIRTSMLNYLKSLNKIMSFNNGILVYSFWSGYKEQTGMKAFLHECEKMGLQIITLHTSGHADHETIKRLIDVVKPKKILPIHTENSKWFEEIT